MLEQAALHLYAPFSTLQDAGLPVLRSLKILENQMKPGALKNALIDVVDDVESGATLSEAFNKHPRCFDRLYVNMVKAGEAGGALEVIMQRLADFKERAQSLAWRITGAMIYPIAVISVAVGILTFIMVYIIPKFEKIFADFQMKLPWLTEELMEVSHWFADYWYVLPLFPLGWWLFIKLVRLNRIGNYVVDWTYLRIPIVGTIIEKTIVARTTIRTLGTLVSSGVPILEALAIEAAKLLPMPCLSTCICAFMSQFAKVKTIVPQPCAKAGWWTTWSSTWWTSVKKPVNWIACSKQNSRRLR